MRRKDGKVVIVAIMCISALEIYALSLGHDGILMTTMVGIIAGLAGWVTPTPKFIKGR